jgi:hypothetical protein
MIPNRDRISTKYEANIPRAKAGESTIVCSVDETVGKRRCIPVGTELANAGSPSSRHPVDFHVA